MYKTLLNKCIERRRRLHMALDDAKVKNKQKQRLEGAIDELSMLISMLEQNQMRHLESFSAKHRIYDLERADERHSIFKRMKDAVMG